ncbi:MAG: 3-isopropylmalate dehydratase small subunit [Gammaproteobacteria bacterium]
MHAITIIESHTVVMPNSDIDTDQIIPARFLTTTERSGLGKHLFSEWRYNEDGSDNAEFVLNTPAAEGCSVLVAGDNFGCGSSREHAPWSLVDFGFKAVISTSMADIFRSNALKNGLLPIVVPKDFHQRLLNSAGEAITINLDKQTVTLGGDSVHFDINSFSRYCLMNGVDELGFLQQHLPQIESYERGRT